MYSPSLKEKHIRKLYRLKLAVKKPMTVLVAEAVEQYLNQYQSLIKEASNEESTSN